MRVFYDVFAQYLHSCSASIYHCIDDGSRRVRVGDRYVNKHTFIFSFPLKQPQNDARSIIVQTLERELQVCLLF